MNEELMKLLTQIKDKDSAQEDDQLQLDLVNIFHKAKKIHERLDADKAEAEEEEDPETDLSKRTRHDYVQDQISEEDTGERTASMPGSKEAYAFGRVLFFGN